MRYRRLVTLVAVLVSCCAPAFAHHMAVVTQKQSSVQNLSSVELRKMFRSDMKKWPNGRDIVIVINRNSSASMEMLQRFTRLTGDKAKAFLAEHKSQFVVVDSDDQVLDTVSTTVGALGVLGVRAIDSRIKVLKIDGKLPLEKDYLPD